MKPDEARKFLMEKFGRWGEGELLYALSILYDIGGMTEEEKNAFKVLIRDYIKRNCNERLPEALNIKDLIAKLEKCLDEETKELGTDVFTHFLGNPEVRFVSPEEEEEILREFEEELRDLGVIK